ncbi:MAG: hypothetical protein IPJ89_02090 [Candidatus Iainarchaeum archaeon]|uniref:DoxX family membrane protein n=1 Tax=Candidatus Iainarchaeum sp. TaxID=3101447 RepID=A0A7T9DKK5_9ARCH|nr:MAG: hypothetical protein IPJ89_02090 [Candidatus Diapherotrites archaeon]
MKLAFEQKMMGLTRISLGFIFFWAFIDKLWGLGFATTPAKSWLAGASPTMGFLSHASGPFAEIFHALAGLWWVDGLFMLGLLGIGAALILGIGVRIAGYAGALLVLMMWSAVLPPANNPILDDHIVYFFILLAFTHMKVGRWWGFGEKWSKSDLVKANPILE